jgi:glycosyltransferase involved in cell wall biosynthesis
MKRILMIAYHFPPLAGSSGIQRTLRFVQHLPEFGWEPIVLTTRPFAYERTSDDLLADIPAGTIVSRAFALDTARHLSIAKRYPGFLARPDRWMSWKFDGIRRGLKLIRQYRPQVIWSTYPIATAHIIGAELQKRTRLPWVADFRDPMAQEGYPADPITWQYFKRIEMTAMQNASVALFTTPGAARIYRERYPEAKARIEVLENGYDEETFAKAEAELHDRAPLNPGHLTLLHSGIVYPTERDPTALFQALAQLRHSHHDLAMKLKLRFRAAAHDDLLRALAREFGVMENIEIFPAIPYREALAEMLRADGLLLLQAANCNDQIPAKLYEYLRAKRPIIALTPFEGDTGLTLRHAGISTIAPLDDACAIAELLTNFAHNPNSGSIAEDNAITSASRSRRSAEFANLLARVIEE